MKWGFYLIVMSGCTLQASSQRIVTGGGPASEGTPPAQGASTTGGTETSPPTSGGDAPGGGAPVVGAPGGPTVAQVTLTPATITLTHDATQAFTCTVSGESDGACIWSASDGGTITAAGEYTAPAGNGTYHVVAASHADPSLRATATIIVPAPASGEVGMWEYVKPAGMDTTFADFGGENYGVQDVVTDPARPSDFYAFVCYQGVWKSTDYGLTWSTSKIDTGSAPDNANLDGGRPWTAAIDPNPNRDPSTPPTLYAAAGYGDNGLFKSTDGGVNWKRYDVGNTTGLLSSDIYSLDIDPGNSQHLITGFHDVGLSESTDGGVHWRTVAVPSGFGISVYPFFVHSTSAAATSTTWITEAQWSSSTGNWLTTDSGAHWSQPTINGAPFKVEHGHGSAQIFQDGRGGIYAAGTDSNGHALFKSADYGRTWSVVNNGNVAQNSVFGTPNYIYASNPYASDGTTVAQHLQRSPTSDGVTWSDWDPIDPTDMANGAKRAAVSFDGTHYVIVTGNWDAGLWRYVEAAP